MGDQQTSGRPVSALFAACPVISVCLGVVLVNAAMVLWLSLLGRDFLSAAGPLRWWSASILPQDNSQHLSDPYSLVHATVGAVLYFISMTFWPDRPVGMRFFIVIASSGVWEGVENTPWVIDLFNGFQCSSAYSGDSIVNALSDTACVALGFLLARVLQCWAVAVLGAAAATALMLAMPDGPMQVHSDAASVVATSSGACPLR